MFCEWVYIIKRLNLRFKTLFKTFNYMFRIMMVVKTIKYKSLFFAKKEVNNVPSSTSTIEVKIIDK